MLPRCPRKAWFTFAAFSCLQAAITAWSRADLAALPTPLPASTPVLSPAPLRLLAAAILSRDGSTRGPAFLKVFAELGAAVNGGKSVGTAVRELLTREGMAVAGQEPLWQNLLANCHTAAEFGLFTPENLERMRAGTRPIITIGG